MICNVGMYVAFVSVVFGSVEEHGKDSSLLTCSSRN